MSNDRQPVVYYNTHYFDYRTNITTISIRSTVGKEFEKSSCVKKLFNYFPDEQRDGLSIQTDGSETSSSHRVGSTCARPRLKVDIDRLINIYGSILLAKSKA